MKLGPALKLKSIINKKLGPAHAEICVHCSHCHASSKSTNAPLEGLRNSALSYQEQHSNSVTKLEGNTGGQGPSISATVASALPSAVPEDRRSPSETANVSRGNTPGNDIKEEPIGRTSSRNSITAENKND